MAKYKGTREDILRAQARERRLNKESKESAMTAFKPEFLYGTDQENEDDWENSGVMDTVRGTLGEDDYG
jgi:hypothetical protein